MSLKMSASLTGATNVLTKLGNLKNIPTAEQKNAIGKIGVDGIKANFKGNPLHWAANKKSTRAAKGHGQINVGVGPDHMRDDTTFRITSNGVEFINRNSHATYAETGTRPHTIKPHNRRGVLAFTGDDGETVFAKEVHHPGTLARPFMVLTKAVRDRTMAVMRQAIRDAFKKGPGTGGPLGKGL